MDAVGTTSPVDLGVQIPDLTKKTQEIEQINLALLKDINAAFENAVSKAKSAGGSLAIEKLEELRKNTESSIEQMNKESEDKLTHTQHLSSAPSPIPPAQSNHPLLSAVFDELLRNINESIEQAIKKAEQTGVSSKTIEAGKQIVLAIEHAKNAYAADLNKTVDKITKTANKQMEELKKMTNSIRENEEKDLSELSSHAQKLIKDLPLRYWQPQLNNVTAQYVVTADKVTENVMITCLGAFKYAKDKDFEPSLTIGSSVFKPTYADTQRLAFSIPIAAAFEKPDATKNQYTLASLQMPYEAGWFQKDKQAFQYKAWVETPALVQEQTKATTEPTAVTPPPSNS